MNAFNLLLQPCRCLAANTVLHEPPRKKELSRVKRVYSLEWVDSSNNGLFSACKCMLALSEWISCLVFPGSCCSESALPAVKNRLDEMVARHLFFLQFNLQHQRHRWLWDMRNSYNESHIPSPTSTERHPEPCTWLGKS